MKKFRILQNDHHFIVQKKCLFFWLNLTYICWEKIPKFHLFIKAKRYTSLLSAEQAIIDCRKYYSELKKENSKYTVAKSKVCTELYNKMNEEE